MSPRSEAAVGWTGTEVVVVGGNDLVCGDIGDCALGNTTGFADGAALDPEARAWRPIADAPVAVSSASAVALGDALFFLAISDPRYGDPVLLRYDVPEDRWRATGLPAPVISAHLVPTDVAPVELRAAPAEPLARGIEVLHPRGHGRLGARPPRQSGGVLLVRSSRIFRRDYRALTTERGDLAAKWGRAPLQVATAMEWGVMGYRRIADVIYEVVDGRAMLVSVDGSELLSLNPVGTRVWELMDEHAGDAERLASALLSEVEGVDRDELVSDITDFVATLSSESLIERS